MMDGFDKIDKSYVSLEINFRKGNLGSLEH